MKNHFFSSVFFTRCPLASPSSPPHNTHTVVVHLLFCTVCCAHMHHIRVNVLLFSFSLIVPTINNKWYCSHSHVDAVYLHLRFHMELYSVVFIGRMKTSVRGESVQTMKQSCVCVCCSQVNDMLGCI